MYLNLTKLILSLQHWKHFLPKYKKFPSKKSCQICHTIKPHSMFKEEIHCKINLLQSFHIEEEVRVSEYNKMASFRASANNEFKAFCAESSIHGLKYMSDNKLPHVIRGTWFILCFLSFLYSGYVIQKNVEGMSSWKLVFITFIYDEQKKMKMLYNLQNMCIFLKFWNFLKQLTFSNWHYNELPSLIKGLMQKR